MEDAAVTEKGDTASSSGTRRDLASPPGVFFVPFGYKYNYSALNRLIFDERCGRRMLA